LKIKIENLEEQLKDKEMQITTIRSKLSNNTVGSGTMYHANLMKTLDQKDRVIDKLTRDAHNYQLQVQQQQELNKQESKQVSSSSDQSELVLKLKELAEKLDAKNKETEACQNEVYDLKDEIEMLKTQLLRKDSHVNSLELSLTQKNEEIEMIEEKVGRLVKQQQQQMALAANSAGQQEVEIENMKKQLGYLQREVATKETQVQNLINEVESDTCLNCQF